MEHRFDRNSSGAEQVEQELTVIYAQARVHE